MTLSSRCSSSLRCAARALRARCPKRPSGDSVRHARADFQSCERDRILSDSVGHGCSLRGRAARAHWQCRTWRSRACVTPSSSSSWLGRNRDGHALHAGGLGLAHVQCRAYVGGPLSGFDDSDHWHWHRDRGKVTRASLSLSHESRDPGPGAPVRVTVSSAE
eukprot:1796337-Rhodomonas_salina.3